MGVEVKSYREDTWQAALVKFLDTLTELAKLGTEACRKQLNPTAGLGTCQIDGSMHPMSGHVCKGWKAGPE